MRIVEDAPHPSKIKPKIRMLDDTENERCRMYVLPQEHHCAVPSWSSFYEHRRAYDEIAICMGRAQKRRKFARGMGVP